MGILQIKEHKFKVTPILLPTVFPSSSSWRVDSPPDLEVYHLGGRLSKGYQLPNHQTGHWDVFGLRHGRSSGRGQGEAGSTIPTEYVVSFLLISSPPVSSSRGLHLRFASGPFGGGVRSLCSDFYSSIWKQIYWCCIFVYKREEPIGGESILHSASKTSKAIETHKHSPIRHLLDGRGSYGGRPALYWRRSSSIGMDPSWNSRL